MKIGIKAFSHFLPGRPLSNQELIDRYRIRMRADWVLDHLGVSTRHWVRDEEATSDLAYHAVKNLQLPPTKKASLWLATVSPDYFSPSTSSLVKTKLHWDNDLPTYDINSACAGFVAVTALASDYLRCSESQDAIIVASEVRSKFLDINDRKTFFLFGDGSAGLWLSKDPLSPWEIDWNLIWTSPASAVEVIVKTGGSRLPVLSQGSDPRPVISFVNGEELSNRVITELPEAVLKKLAERNLSPQAYDHFIIHPGNKIIYQQLLAALNIPAEKASSCLEDTANVGSATIGVALSKFIGTEAAASVNKILLITIGAGGHLGLMSINRR